MPVKYNMETLLRSNVTKKLSVILYFTISYRGALTAQSNIKGGAFCKNS